MDLKVQLKNDGPSKALIQLSVVFHARHAETLQTGLASVASNLGLRGLRPQVNQSAAGTNRQSTVLMWKDKGQSLLEGWSVESTTPNQISLRLSLGGASASRLPSSIQTPSSGLHIRFDAKQLRDLGWLKGTWTRLVQQAGQGELLLKPMLGHRSGQTETLYWLKGQLSLR